MTSAARPTFDPAKGGHGLRESRIGRMTRRLGARDLASQTKLKERFNRLRMGLPVTPVTASNASESISASETNNTSNRGSFASIEAAKKYRKFMDAKRERDLAIAEGRPIPDNPDYKEELAAIYKPFDPLKWMEIDKDAEEDEDVDQLTESDFPDDDDDEEDQAELMAELNRIKEERRAEREQSQREGTDSSSAFTISRRWDDDVPFKNCAQPGAEPTSNLTPKQEFYKKFVERYL